MKYDPQIHHRRSIRLKGYDYSQPGGYFVTIVTQNRECLFGDVVDGEMVSNELGKMVLFTWNDLPNHNQHIILDEFVIMPNHFHGIIFINAGAGSNIAGAGLDIVGVDLNVDVGAGSEPAPTMNKMKKRHGLPEIVRQFKTFSARRINKNRGTSGAPVWQRNYWEQIIRNEKSLNNFRQYIIQNPSNWQTDAENPVPSD
jgi:putative transposase